MSAKIAIIGGGPAGLSLAQELRAVYRIESTVFEAEEIVGGKSSSFERHGVVCELGTCYATRGDRWARLWMRRLGIHLTPTGTASVDGTEYFSYAKGAPGHPLSIQGLRYLSESRRLRQAMNAANPRPATLHEAATPIGTWLKRRNLHKIERLHHRALTNMGYGSTEDTSTLQAINWVDADLIFSGLTNNIVMPVEGWSEFWRRMASTLDVRTASPVIQIQRSHAGHVVTTPKSSEHFDYIVCAIPVDDFTELTVPTEMEQYVNTSIDWLGYATTLLAVDNWFERETIRSFRGGIEPGAERGALMSARFEATSMELGGNLYILNQRAGVYTPDELREIAFADIRKDGGDPKAVILQKIWKYFAQYKREAIEDGLLARLRGMQGEQRTFYTGATFSHEAVSKITAFNTQLARQIARRVRDDQTART